MNLLNKSLLSALAISFALGLAACGKKEEGTTGTGTTEQPATGTGTTGGTTGTTTN